jgi:hypothetical protein
VIGRRVKTNAAGWIDQPLEPGEYFKAANPVSDGSRAGSWYGKTPNGHVCNLGGHSVIEHDDGTISVSPSIRVWIGGYSSGHPEQTLWHGYLEHGVWRQV